MEKIVIDIRMIGASGIGTYLQNLIPYIIKEFEAVFLINKADLLYAEALNLQNIVLLKGDIYSIREQFELKKKIPHCDLFWSPHFNIPILPINARKRIVTIHDTYHLSYLKNLPWLQKFYAKIFYSLATKLSNQIITVSNFSKNELKKYLNVSDEKINVIYNGVDTELFKKITDKTVLEKIKLKYGLANKFILTVGNVKPHKNLVNLIKAFQHMQQYEQPDYELVIIGKKDGFINRDYHVFDIINNDNALKNKINFTGYIPTEDLPFIYNLASVFVFPSLYEGFGLPPLEAFASGTLTVVSNKSSIPEICGEATTYFNPEDPMDISAKIEFVLKNNNTAQSQIERGFARLNKFSWKLSAEKHIRLFKSLV